MSSLVAEAGMGTGMITLVVLGVILQFFFDGLVGVLLYLFSKRDRREEMQEGRMHELASKLVDERFRGMSHEVKNHVQGFVLALDDMKDRLTQRDGVVNELGERDHKLELQVLARLNEIKTYVIEHSASKGDLKAHQERMDGKVDEINDRLNEQDKTLAVIQRDITRAAGSRDD